MEAISRRMKIAALLVVVAGLSACGGGGGGGGSAGTGTTPGNSITEKGPASTEEHADVQLAYSFNKTLTRSTTSPAGLVGIVDSYFETSRLTDLGNRIAVYNREGGKGVLSANGYTHGENVALVIGKGNTIQMYAIGANDGSAELLINSGMEPTLHQLGVRIFNHSYGTSADVSIETTYPATGPFVQFYKQAVNPANFGTGQAVYTGNLGDYDNSLFIWAAGNEEKSGAGGKDHASPDARLPEKYPELEKGWLVVTALDTDNASKASWANAVGESAKNWGIAAPGVITDIGSSKIMGTSFAAPAVTRAAANVQERYPWMSADLIRTTLLTTADDIGAAGVDAVFGWGRLNETKALGGPAAFDMRLAFDKYGNKSNEITIYVDGDKQSGGISQNIIFSNDIKTTGNDADVVIIGENDGMLVFSGNNTYTGKTTVDEGVLIVSNSSKSSHVVNSGGNLAFVGYANIESLSGLARPVNVSGNITANSGGMLSIYAGGLTLTGNIEIKSGAALKIDVLSTTTISGTLSNSGTVFLTVSPTISTVTDTNPHTRTLITAGNISGISTATVHTNANPYINASLVNIQATSVDVQYDRRTTTDVVSGLMSVTPASVEATAANLDATFDTLAAGSGSDEIRLAAAEIIASPAALLPQTWDSLSGEIYASAQNITFKQAKVTNKTLADRLYAISDEDGRANTGVWFEGVGNSGRIHKEGWALGKTKIWGGQAGFDARLGERAIIGAAVTASKAKATFDKSAGETRSTDLTLHAYGMYKFDNGLYTLGRIGMGWADVKVDRNITAGASGPHAVKSKRHDLIYSAYAELGWKAALTDRFTLNPFAGLAHDTVRRGKFTEEGYAFGLADGAETYSQTSALVGLRAQAKFDKVKVKAHATHYMALNKEDLSFKAKTVGAPTGPDWDIKGVGLPRHTTWVGVGFEVDVTADFTVNAGYDVSVSRGRANDHVATIGFRYRF